VWGELLLVVVGVAAVTALIGRVVARRRPQEDRAVPRGSAPGGGQLTAGGGGRWTAAGPVAGAFPVERTPHERDVGDAAFVDGFIVGRYLTPGERPHTGDARAGGSGQVAATGGGDELSDDEVDDDAGMSWSHDPGFGGSEPDEHGHDEFDVGGEHADDGFGSADGLEDDDW
jgi:hypothetical protein